MADMIFKRILHPVGQGAFFTEHFQNEGDEKAFLNVVYDCGSFTSVPNLMDYEIRNTFEKKDHINTLFLSHFDEDHVNELMTLLNRATIDKDTKVIIPFKYPYLLMVMDEDYPLLASFVMQMFNLGSQVIGVDDDNDENRPGDSVDVDRLNANMTLGGKQVVRISRNQKPIWYYYPFMLSDSTSLQKTFAAKVKDVVNLTDPCEIIEKRKELRDKYKTIGKTKGGVTRINVNTLLMLSFPAEKVVGDLSVWHFDNIYCWINAACCYTGDSNLKGKGYGTVKKLVMEIFDQYSKGTTLGMMQVPHHGSIKCFPAQMADRHDQFFDLAFVNCNPYHRQKVLDSSIIGDFIRSCKVLWLITEAYHSRVEMISELC